LAAEAPRYDPYDWAVHEDPYPFYRALREHAPVYHNAERGFWALSRHDDVLAAFRDPERYSNTEGVSVDPVIDAQAVMSFLAMDPPLHTRVRSLVSRGFTPRRASDLEPAIRNLANHYIDRFIEQGACDFVDDFAGRLPMDVVSELLGVPAADRRTLRTWADLVVERAEGSPEVPPEGMAAAAQLLGYFNQYVAERRENRGKRVDDLTEALMAAELDGERLHDRDIVAFLFLMIIAGNETTTKLLANSLYWAWRNPDQRKLVREDPSLIAAWAEETLRFDPSSQLIARTTTCDVEVRGVTIPKGSRVALLIGAANRDERVFERPDEYDIRRNTSASLAFGQGTHFCLGASLARLEARVALEEVQRRLPDWGIREEGLVRIHSSNVRGFAKMPIEFPA
jgi:cytochrome P450